MLEQGKIVSIEDRIPKLKQQRKKKANRRLIFLLIFFLFLIALVVYFQSPLSNIKAIKVSGNTVFSNETIVDQSGLTEDMNIWKVDEAEIEQVLLKLPEMKEVKVATEFPNTVVISVKEHKRVAYIMEGEDYIPVLENGKTLSVKGESEFPASAPILFQFSEGNVLEKMIVSLGQLPEEVRNSISEIHATPKETDKEAITLYMNDGYEVIATLATFVDKMSHYPAIVAQLDPEVKGIIDLEVGSYFKPYGEGGANENEKEQEEEVEE
ncbi:cell division protein FtsQ/DivIB [Cytobacillus sp. FSL K6-0129]